MAFDYLLGAKGVQMADPMKQAAQFMTLAQAAGQNQLQQYTLAKQQRADAQARALQQIIPTLDVKDDNAIRQAMVNNPDAAEGIMGYVNAQRKAAGEQGKVKAETEKDTALGNKATIESKFKALEAIGNAAAKESQNPSPLSLSRIKSMASFYGIDLPQPGDGDTPQTYLGGLAQQAMSLKDRLAQQETSTHNRATEANATANLAETERFHTGELGIQGSRLALDRENQSKPQLVTDTNGNVYTVDPRAGTGRTVTGPDGQPLNKGDKPLTESQGAAAAFGARMQQANNVLDQLTSSGANLASPTMSLAGGWTNPIASAKAQQANQAKLNFMTAALRKESGASISQSEYDTFDRTYFPQIGDSAAVQAQKAALRQQAIQNMRTVAGPSGSKAIDAAGSSAASSGGWSIKPL